MMWRTCVVMFFLVVLLFAAKSVLACKGDQIVFEDSFATLDPSWGDASDKLSVSNGKLTIRPEAAKRYQSINQGTVLQDMDACVKVSLASSEDPSWGGGFIFWASDYNNYYWLAVSGNGWFTVQRRSNGQDSASVAWTESAAVKKGVGQWNSLRVVTKGAQATIYINDVQVATFQGQPPQGGGMIGVYGDSPDKVPNTWEFSELKITNVVGVPSQVNVVPSPVAPTGSECQGEVIYEDNFATMDPAWGEPDEKVSVNNGKMVIQPAVNSGWSVLNQGNIFQDMQVCVKLTLAKSDEPAGASAGLLFWAKDYGEYYYAYLINGGLTVARWIGGRWLYPVSLRENAAIKKGLGETNQLRLVTKGAQATLFVNGTEIVSFKGQPPQGGSLVGLRGESSANSPAVWEFSGLKITKP